MLYKHAPQAKAAHCINGATALSTPQIVMMLPLLLAAAFGGKHICDFPHCVSTT
jgi:hypothetical protein